MVTVEHVSRRVFSDRSWFLKTIVGFGLIIMLLTSPWALGYMYRMAALGQRGLPPDLPDWDDWRTLFVEGVRFFLILVVLVLCPVVLCWLLALPVGWFLQGTLVYAVFWPYVYIPFAPILLLAAPMSGAALFRYLRREDFREAFRVPLLFRMVVVAREQLFIPTLAYLGSVLALFPVFPYALFTGGLVYFYYCNRVFHDLDVAAREKASARSVVRR